VPSVAGKGLALFAALSVVQALPAAASSASASADLPPELTSDGADLVEAGRAYLERGELGPAIEVLTEASRRDPRDRHAHLLMALALSRVRVEHADAICEWEAWIDRIEAHLQAAWALDASTLDRVESEPELAPIQQALSNSIGLRLWPSRGRAWRPTGPPQAVLRAGFPVMRLEGVVKRRKADDLLLDLQWYGVDAQGEHDETVLDFRGDGVVLRATVVRDADHSKHAVYARGTWSLDKDGLHLDLPDEVSHLDVTLDGLRVGTGKEAVVYFVDQPQDCTRPFDVWAGLPEELRAADAQ